jgi:putative SOS response-associated peptidase YedK
MCGRFTQAYTWAEVHAFLSVIGPPRNVRARYNIAPTTPIDIVRPTEDGRELIQARWGLIPAWWKKTARETPATFNARADSVDTKPMFRSAFKSRRCLIPASGFYEWTGPRADRRPLYITAADGSPVLAMAGLWDAWRDPETSETVLSATVIVTAANDFMAPIHDRMPVFIPPGRFDAWLSGAAGVEILQPAPDAFLRAWPVGTRVNRAGVGDDDPTLVEPLAS